MRKSQLLIIVLIIFSWSCSQCSSKVQTNNSTVNNDSTKTILSGLNIPWEILWGKDDHIWMTERSGKISKVNPANGSVVFSGSIAEVVNNNEVPTFTNPAFDKLNISTFNGISFSHVKIYSMTGKNICNSILNGNQVDVSFIETGIYIAEFINNEKMVRIKFLKQ